jgi:hypothetical protein
LETAKSRFWRRFEIAIFGNGNRAKDCEGSKIKMLRKMRISKRRQEADTSALSALTICFVIVANVCAVSVQYLKELNKA